MPVIPAVELVSTIAPPAPRLIMDGIAISTVLNTPVRLTSITSCQARWSSSSSVIGAIPALASTMSTGPSSATPASNAARSPASSRTSAWRATIRRSSASTALTVSARSSGVAIGYATLAIWAQMSTAMMSAPSSASRIAWLRPCPRAAPVMKATLPSSFPATPLAPFTSVTDSGRPGSAAGAEAGQGTLVAGRVRRTPADRHRDGPGGHGRPRPVRVVAGRFRRDGSWLNRGQGCGAMSLDALRVRAVQGQPGEELGRHAPAPARVVGRAGGAGAAGLRPAQVGEQLGFPPHGRESAGAADAAGQEAVVDGERAGVDVAHRVDQADHPARAAQVEPGQRVAVGSQMKERVAGQHLLTVSHQPVVELALLGGGGMQFVPDVGAAP